MAEPSRWLNVFFRGESPSSMILATDTLALTTFLALTRPQPVPGPSHRH